MILSTLILLIPVVRIVYCIGNMYMFAFIISIVALIFVFSLKGKVDKLEKKLNRLEGSAHTVGTEPVGVAASISSLDTSTEFILNI